MFIIMICVRFLSWLLKIIRFLLDTQRGRDLSQATWTWYSRIKFYFIPIVPSSDPSAHSSFPLLTQLFGIQVSLHFSLSGFVQPASKQSNSDDLHVAEKNESFLFM